jgi:hypothetical protein
MYVYFVNLYFRCVWQFRYLTYSKSTRSSIWCWRSVYWHFYKKYTLHSTISEEFLIYCILSFLMYWQGMYNVNRCLFVCLFVNATFNNISVISSRSVFIGGGNRGKPPTCRKSWQPLSHNVAHLALIEIRTHSISGDSKSNYHTITARTAPNVNRKFKEYWLTIILILTKWLTISHLNITEHKKDEVK